MGTRFPRFCKRPGNTEALGGENGLGNERSRKPDGTKGIPMNVSFRRVAPALRLSWLMGVSRFLCGLNAHRGFCVGDTSALATVTVAGEKHKKRPQSDQ